MSAFFFIFEIYVVQGINKSNFHIIHSIHDIFFQPFKSKTRFIIKTNSHDDESYFGFKMLTKSNMANVDNQEDPLMNAFFSMFCEINLYLYLSPPLFSNIICTSQKNPMKNIRIQLHFKFIFKMYDKSYQG